MKPGVPYYQWKVRDEEGDLIDPHGDPMEHEFPFDFLFGSVEEAYTGLRDWGIVRQYYDIPDEVNEEEDFDEYGEYISPEGWHPEDWVLVKISVELV